MTARPVDPDRTDAVAREPASIIGEFIDDAALMETGRSIGTVGSYRVAQALLTTDDPAAVAALLATLAERHPDQYLTAGRDAGVDHMVANAARPHTPDNARSGCSCGFCAWSPEHVVLMAWREVTREP